MANKHIVELLIEANKNITSIIDKIENDNSENNNQMIVDRVNDVIRQLDKIVEQVKV